MQTRPPKRETGFQSPRSSNDQSMRLEYQGSSLLKRASARLFPGRNALGLIVAGVKHRRLDEGILDGGAGDETRAATKGEIEKTPLDEDENAALELDNVHQVDKEPDEPGQK